MGKLLRDVLFCCRSYHTQYRVHASIIKSGISLSHMKIIFRSNIEERYIVYLLLRERGVEIRRVNADHVFKDFSGK